MSHIPLIRANVMHSAIAFMEEIEAPTERLLTEAKLPLSLLHEPEALLPLKHVFAFFEKTARAEGIGYFGLSVGQRTQISDLGALGRLLSHSPTLYDAIQTWTHMVSSYNSGEQIWLTEREEKVWLCQKFMDGLDVGRHHAVHYSMLIMIHLVQLAAGFQWKPTEIHLETNDSHGLEQVEWLSDVKILLEQDATAIVLPRSLLSLLLKNLDEYSNEQRDQDYETLRSSAPVKTFSGSVRQTMRFLLRQGYPNIRSVAQIAGMSVRSFQRQLSEAGLTYSYLVEQVRFERSVQLLRDSTNKLTDIASEIGYKDAANFTRAFRRWAGTSPSDFRSLR